MAWGKFLILILSTVPVFLWYSPEVGFKQLADPINFGQIAGLTGASLLSLNFVLSSRFHFLEKMFGGLNKVYLTHRKTGIYAVILLSIHPILIALSYARYSLSIAYSVLFPSFTSNFAPWFGIFAYLLLITLIVLTLFAKLPYHIWKLTHKFMGVALILALIHIYFIPSTVSYNMPLRTYMLSILSVGIVSYLYRVVFEKYLVKRFVYKVIKVSFHKEVTKITLIPIGKRLIYKPGQFIFIKFISSQITNEEHPFSLTSSPKDKFLSVSVKNLGDYTKTFKNLENETIAYIEGPFGKFSHLNTSLEDQIWIAGGIGITPFVSMAKSLSKNASQKIRLYYITKTKEDAVHMAELEKVSRDITAFDITRVNTKSHGRFTAKHIEKFIAEKTKTAIFICGPDSMMKDLKKQFIDLGIPTRNIYTEEFYFRN